MTTDLIHPNEQQYIDQIRAKILAKYPRLLFALSDEAVKTFCLRIIISQIIPETELLSPRPRFIEAVPAAIEMISASPRKVWESMTGKAMAHVPDEVIAEIIPVGTKALKRMFECLNSDYYEGKYAWITDLGPSVVGMWPTFVIWLYMYHNRPVRVLDYFSMALTISVYVHQFNQLPPQFEELWASTGADSL